MVAHHVNAAAFSTIGNNVDILGSKTNMMQKLLTPRRRRGGKNIGRMGVGFDGNDRRI